MPDNASTKAADYATTHGFKILRVGAGMRAQAFATLQELEKELAGIVESAGEKPTLNDAKYKAMQNDAQATISDAYKLISKNHGKALDELAGIEWQASNKMINRAVGVDLVSGNIPPKLLEAIAKAPVVLGHSSADWWNGQSADLRQKFQGEMAKGTLLGETTPQLLKRLRGAGVFETPAAGAPQGLVKKAKRDAEALILTSSASIANHARLESFKAKSDLIKGIEWVSTLDSRTTLICIGLDGKQWRLPDMQPIGHDKAYPGSTAHWRCRSTIISVLYSWAELSGKKLPTLDNATLQERVDSILEKSGMSEEQRAAARVNTRASMDGQASKAKTYEQWAESKGSEFIEQVIGPGRASLYNTGKMTFSDLTDQNNRPITLKQLAASVATGKPPPETLGVDFLPPPRLPKFADAAEEEAKATKQKAAEEQAKADALQKATLLAGMKEVFLGSGTFTDQQLAMWNRLPQDEKDVYLADWNAAKAEKKAAAKAEYEAKLAQKKAAEEAIIAQKTAEEAAKQAAILKAKQEAEALAAKLAAEKKAAEEAAAKKKAAEEQAKAEASLLKFLDNAAAQGGAFTVANNAAKQAAGKGAAEVLKAYNTALDVSVNEHLAAFEKGLNPSDPGGASDPLIKKAFALVKKSPSVKGASAYAKYVEVVAKADALALEASNKKLEKSIIKKYAAAVTSKGKPVTDAEKAYLATLTPDEKANLDDAIETEITKQTAKAAKKAGVKPPAGATPAPKAAASLAGSNTIPPPPPRGLPKPPFPNEPVPAPDTLKKVKSLGGSTGAELHKDNAGNLFVVKRGAKPDHVREEAAADELYRRMGVRVPAGQVFETPSGPVKVTKYEADAVSLAEALNDPKRSAAVKKALQEDLAVDILLGNWDVAGAGLDNVLVRPDNSVVRIDNGGSLRFRAMGTAKAGNEWDSTPTELFTMRRLANPDGSPLPNDGANHARLFSDARITDLARRIEQIDRRTIEGMALDDVVKLTLLERYDELRVVARRTLDQGADGWQETYAESQAALSFSFKYKGIREAIPNKIEVDTTYGGITVKADGQGGFGRLRSKNGSNVTAPQLKGTPLASDKFFSDIETAVKNYNYHSNLGGKPESLNKAKQAAALAHEPALLALKKSGNPDEKKMADSYLAALETVKAGKAGKTLKAVGKFEQALLPPPAGAKKATPVKTTSITAEVFNAMTDKHGTQGKVAMEIVARWQQEQGWDSWNEAARVAKYWMATRTGKTAEYYWSGNRNNASSLSDVRKKYAAAVAAIGNNGEAILEDAFLHWHTMTQDVLTWADMPFNDRERGVVRLVRTESNEVLAASSIKKTDVGKTVQIQRSGAESHSIFRETYVMGDSGNAFWMAVPHHRVLGTYLTERRPGESKGAFLGDGENEFVTDSNMVPSKFSAKDPSTEPQSRDASKWGVPLDHLRP